MKRGKRFAAFALAGAILGTGLVAATPAPQSASAACYGNPGFTQCKRFVHRFDPNCPKGQRVIWYLGGGCF